MLPPNADLTPELLAAKHYKGEMFRWRRISALVLGVTFAGVVTTDVLGSPLLTNRLPLAIGGVLAGAVAGGRALNNEERYQEMQRRISTLA